MDEVYVKVGVFHCNLDVIRIVPCSRNLLATFPVAPFALAKNLLELDGHTLMYRFQPSRSNACRSSQICLR